jgi:hypothetical protein
MPTAQAICARMRSRAATRRSGPLFSFAPAWLRQMSRRILLIRR